MWKKCHVLFEWPLTVLQSGQSRGRLLQVSLFCCLSSVQLFVLWKLSTFCSSFCLPVHLCFNLLLAVLCLCLAFVLMLLSFEADKAIADYFKQVFFSCPFKCPSVCPFARFSPFKCLSVCIFLHFCPSKCLSLFIFVSVCLFFTYVLMFLIFEANKNLVDCVCTSSKYFLCHSF